MGIPFGEVREVLFDLGRHAVPGLADALVEGRHDGYRGYWCGVEAGLVTALGRGGRRPLEVLVHGQDRPAIPLKGLAHLVATVGQFSRRGVQALQRLLRRVGRRAAPVVRQDLGGLIDRVLRLGQLARRGAIRLGGGGDLFRLGSGDKVLDLRRRAVRARAQRPATRPDGIRVLLRTHE
jgi:hypothetical protein